jgi:hypothetical protein
LGLGNQAGVVLSYYLSKSGSVFSFAFVILFLRMGKASAQVFISKVIYSAWGNKFCSLSCPYECSRMVSEKFNCFSDIRQRNKQLFFGAFHF